MPKKPRIVEVVKSSYQPTKAELEGEIQLDIPGETHWNRFVNLTRAVVQPVRLRHIEKPRSRRR